MPVMPGVGDVPSINLMPRSEVERRDRDRLTGRWVWAVFAALVGVLVLVAVTFLLKWSADQRLAAEHTQTNRILLELTSLSKISDALTTQQELTLFRAEAMATDLAWAPVISKVEAVLPGRAELTGFDLTVGAPPHGEAPTEAQGLAGTVSIESSTPLDIVPIIRSLRGVDGVLYADGQSVTAGGGSDYAYLLTVEFDQTVYSGAYAEEGDQ